ncbi:MAG: hypothetical protein K1X74_01485 [Pirellulales bacterium]|nr:hypothetical protein [Pirellulales bacterium]
MIALRWLFLFVGIYLAAVLEVALDRAWSVGDVAPSVFVLVAILAMQLGRLRPAWLVAGLVGLAADLNAGGILGVRTGGLMLVVAAMELLPPGRWQRHPICLCATVGLAALAVDTWVALAGIVGLAPSLPATWYAPLVNGLYTAGLTLPCTLIASWMGADRQPAPHFAVLRSPLSR